MKTLAVLTFAAILAGTLLRSNPTLCHWEMEAALNGGPTSAAMYARCYRVAVRKVNERTMRYVRLGY